MSFSMKDLMGDHSSQSQPSSAATPNTGVPATPSSSPVTSSQTAPGFFSMKDLMGDDSSKQSRTPQASQGDQSKAGNGDVAQHGLLRRAWDFVNSPIADLSLAGHRILPEGVKTSDIIKAAAFEKMYGEAYIPGFNDFDTKAEAHLGPAPAKITTQDGHPYVATPESHAFKNAVRTFIAGVGKDSSDMAAGFTSPLSLGTLSLGAVSKAPGAVGTAAKALNPLVGTAFGLQGAGQTLHGLYKTATEGATPENVQETLSGAGQALLGAHADLDAVGARVENIRNRVTPVNKTIAGQDVPVRPETKGLATLVTKGVDPDIQETAARNTASAVQKGVGNIIGETTGSNADTNVSNQDRLGIRAHAKDVRAQAVEPMQELDRLSNNAYSDAQKMVKDSKKDFSTEGRGKFRTGLALQDEIMEAHRDDMAAKGYDVDEMKSNYRKAGALDKIASKLDIATGPREGGGYDLDGVKLAKQIDNIRKMPDQENLFTQAGLGETHVDALAQLADTLREQQEKPQFGTTTKLAAKAVGVMFASHSLGTLGITSLFEGLTGEKLAENLGSKALTKLFGEAMTSEPVAREMTTALKGGAAGLSNWNKFKQTAADLWRNERGEAGLPGTVGTENPNSPASEAGNVPTFFSKAEQVANQKVSTGSGDSMLAALRNNGVKENEIQWLGLDDYLKGKPKVSKADLQQYINDHKIALNETNLGGNDWKNVRDLTVQRGKVYAENNRIWSDIQYGSKGKPATMMADVFNAIKSGEDTEPLIKQLPENIQNAARRFVETDRQLQDLDKQIGDAETNVKPTKYESYTLPGDKDNYTEKLLTLPSENSDVRQAYEKAENERNTYISTGSLVPGDVELRFQDAQTAMRKAANANASKTFQSSHFDEPNVLAHTRFDDRTSLDGKKTLLLEELQSDWHQKGKKVGYQNPAPTKLPDGIFVVPENGKFQVVNREGNPLLSRLFGSEQDAKTAALTHYGEGAGNPGVPNAPFKSDWHELVIKRMLRHAAENGYDRLAWTTGDQQAARYDLSKHIDSLDWMKNDDGTYSIAANKNGDEMFRREGLDASELADHVGKDAAQKIQNEEGKNYRMQGTHNMGTLKGLDLKIGGDWAKALYDRAIPNFLNKYAKKWGAKVGETELDTAPSGSLRYEIVDPKGNVQDAFRNRAGAEDAVEGYNEAHRGVGKWTVRDNGTTEKVHSIDITPKMRESVLKEGQPIAENETPDWAGKILQRTAA
jgi:hypothetical protein